MQGKRIQRRYAGDAVLTRWKHKTQKDNSRTVRRLHESCSSHSISSVFVLPICHLNPTANSSLRRPVTPSSAFDHTAFGISHQESRARFFEIFDVVGHQLLKTRPPAECHSIRLINSVRSTRHIITLPERFRVCACGASLISVELLT